jgi:hypothetical protein
MPRKVNLPDIYVVAALARNGGHGPWPAILMTTPDPVVAIAVAKEAGAHGYDIDWNDIGVTVIRTAPDALIQRAEQAMRDVYARGGKDADGTIREYFFEPELASAFRVTLSKDWEPSRPLTDPPPTIH